MYIARVHLDHIRNFEDAEVQFGWPTEKPGEQRSVGNVTVVIGDNGGGKTTVLRAVAMSTFGPLLLQMGWVPYMMVRRKTPNGPRSKGFVRCTIMLGDLDGKAGPHSFELHLTSTAATTDRLAKGNYDSPMDSTALEDALFDETSPAFFMVGYGSTRRTESSPSGGPQLAQKMRGVRYQRVASLFEEHVTLTPLSWWLPDLRSRNKGRHSQVITLLNALLPDDAEIHPVPHQREYFFKVRGTKVPFAALSDGYRAYVGWVSDLLYHLTMSCPKGLKLIEVPGVVLVDEIDLHLHPSWQRTVVSTLSRTLPKLQFVVTTHSALVAGSIPSRCLRVLIPRGAKGTEVHAVETNTLGLSVDQLLVSGAFGLDSPREPNTARLLEKLNVKARKGDTRAAEQVMAILAHGSGEEADNGRSKEGAARAAKKARR